MTDVVQNRPIMHYKPLSTGYIMCLHIDCFPQNAWILKLISRLADISYIYNIISQKRPENVPFHALLYDLSVLSFKMLCTESFGDKIPTNDFNHF